MHRGRASAERLPCPCRLAVAASAVAVRVVLMSRRPMALYQDFAPRSADPATIYRRITSLLVGTHSVEVVPDGDGVILRVWLEPHCDPAEHEKLD